MQSIFQDLKYVSLFQSQLKTSKHFFWNESDGSTLVKTVGQTTGKAQCLNQLFILAGSYWISVCLDTFWVVFLASGLCPVHEVTVFVQS